jgi:hypothetical protein
MEWGIVIAFPMVLGMLFLAFGAVGESDYQSFGRTVINPPATDDAEADDVELKAAA